MMNSKTVENIKEQISTNIRWANESRLIIDIAIMATSACAVIFANKSIFAVPFFLEFANYHLSEIIAILTISKIKKGMKIGKLKPCYFEKSKRLSVIINYLTLITFILAIILTTWQKI